MEIHLGIDVGGTFTDIALSIPANNQLLLYKLPSTPEAPDRAIVAGIEALLQEYGFAADSIARLSHGTTVGTNALIQRRCGRVALVTGEGFRDLLEIGRQVRPAMYDVHLDNPEPLVPRQLRFEVQERVLADGTIYAPLDEEGLRRLGRHLAGQAVDAVVVCFLHAYAYPEHETRAVAILQDELPPEIHVLPSFLVYPEFREFERFSTAVLNAALVTVMNAYLDRFTNAVTGLGITAEPKVSQSAGGLMSIDMARRLPIRASLSGPAAGVLGAAYRVAEAGFGDVITLDMGGTSADVSLLHGGQPVEVRERQLAGFPLKLPALDVSAVGAGGGSIAWIDRDGLLKVGPESAGAVPGPACYGLGGNQATVTDANVLLGRLNAETLLDGGMAIHRELAQSAVAELAENLGLTEDLRLAIDDCALGIVQVAAAVMVKAIRAISIERGNDPSGFALFAFGGAGPLHAREVAVELSISTIIVPPHPGILCAEGLLNSDLRADFVRSVLTTLDEGAPEVINPVRSELAEAAATWFNGEDLAPDARCLEWAADLRYRGQNYELPVVLEDRPLDSASCQALLAAFHAAHEQSYGFASLTEPVECVNLKLKAVGLLEKPALPRLEDAAPGAPASSRLVCFAKATWIETPVYRRESLACGQRLVGPAVIEQMDATTLVFPDDVCVVDKQSNLVISLGTEGRTWR
jgi:N-methylhydantoinase A